MIGNYNRQGGGLRLYFDLLACVARADSRISAAEKSALLAAAASCDLDSKAIIDLENSLNLEQPFDLDALLAAAGESLADPGLIVEVVRDAFVLAAADAEVAPLEVEVIDRFLTHAGYDASGRAVLMEWGRRAAQLHLDGLHFAVELRQA